MHVNNGNSIVQKVIKPSLGERFVFIEPLADRGVLLGIQFHLNSFQGFHVVYIVPVIQRRLFVVKWRKSHAFEVSSIPFLSSHHDPHGSGVVQVYISISIRNLSIQLNPTKY